MRAGKHVSMALTLAASHVAAAQVLTRLFLDLVALGLLVGIAFVRRHRRTDLALVYTTFNIGVFAVLTVISTRHVGAGLGFGLFATLSLIRLRSEPYDSVELSYFFAALVLAMINGIHKSPAITAALLDVLVVGAVLLADHPALHQRVRRRRITLDHARTDVDAVRAELEQAHGVRILDLAITDVDLVRDTCQVAYRYQDA
jgi:hypothetical protein